MHVSSAHRKGRGEKGKERKFYDGKPTESSCAIPWSHSLFHGCTLGQAVGTRGVVALGKMGCVNQKRSQSRPTRAVSSNCNMFIQFTFPATHFCLLSPARDTTQSRLFQFLPSKPGSSIKCPCNCQELRDSVISLQACQKWGAMGEWGEGVSYIPTYETATQSSFLSTYCVITTPDLNASACRVGTASPLWSWQGTALDWQPRARAEREWHKCISLLQPIIILLQQMLTIKAMWLFHFLADFTSAETKILQSHFCVPRSPSASLSAN